MVFFDAETERICDELGYDLILPSAELREHLDSKLVTTRLGNEVGAASVPNVMVTVDEYDELVGAATDAGLGTDLVVQTAFQIKEAPDMNEGVTYSRFWLLAERSLICTSKFAMATGVAAFRSNEYSSFLT